jgi:hypothetical protein
MMYKTKKGLVKLADVDEKIIITINKDGKPLTTESTVTGKKKIVIIINNQFTISPNTTQIASGAGKNSAAGNNAALDSSNTLQQQSVGAQGRAKNLGMKGNQCEPHNEYESGQNDEELTIVINNQINESSAEAAATQVASGGGTDSAGGTNAAIQSSNTKQQHAVGGAESSLALNSGMESWQKEEFTGEDEEGLEETAMGIEDPPGTTDSDG